MQTSLTPRRRTRRGNDARAKNPQRSISSLDCIAMCAVLGLALDSKQIARLCRKHGLHTGEEDVDTSYGFYLLHRACHQEGGVVSKRFTKLLNERFSGIVRVVKQTDAGNEEQIVKTVETWTDKCPGGLVWALLMDPRERMQQHGVYLIHKISYAAFRDARTACAETDTDALTAAQAELQQSREQLAQQQAETQRLRQRLAEAEQSASSLEAVRAQQERRISELEETPTREAQLRRRIRKLEHELAQRCQEPCHCSEKAESEPNTNDEARAVAAEDIAGNCPYSDAESLGEQSCGKGKAGCQPCLLDDLRVAIIGGLDRLEPHYRKVVENLGAQFFFHNGNCHAGCQVLRSVVCQADVIMFITRLNSHSALRVVRGLCRKTGKRFTAVRETSPQAIAAALQSSSYASG